MSSPSTDAVSAFLTRCSDTELAERANKELFLTELCDLLDLPHTDPAGPDATGICFARVAWVWIHRGVTRGSFAA